MSERSAATGCDIDSWDGMAGMPFVGSLPGIDSSVLGFSGSLTGIGCCVLNDFASEILLSPEQGSMERQSQARGSPTVPKQSTNC